MQNKTECLCYPLNLTLYQHIAVFLLNSAEWTKGKGMAKVAL